MALQHKVYASRQKLCQSRRDGGPCDSVNGIQECCLIKRRLRRLRRWLRLRLRLRRWLRLRLRLKPLKTTRRTVKYRLLLRLLLLRLLKPLVMIRPHDDGLVR